MSQQSTPLRRLVSIPNAQARLGGIGRTKFYELTKKELRLVKIGRRSFVVEADLAAFIDGLAAKWEIADSEQGASHGCTAAGD